MIAGRFTLLLLIAALSAPLVNAQVTPAAHKLKPGKPVERPIAGGELHTYQVKLKAGEFIRAVVEQRAIDAGIELTGPDGKLVRAANLTEPGGRESLSAEAVGGGIYRLAVTAGGTDALSGSYQLRLEVRKAPTEQDRQRIAAEALLVDPIGLQKLGGKNAEEAIEKMERALAVWRSLGDRYWEAWTLSSIGSANHLLSRFDKSIGRQEQALAISRQIKDQAGEGIAIYRIGFAYNRMSRHEKAIEYLEQALAIRRELKDRNGEGKVLTILGSSYFRMSRYEKAIQYYEEALVANREAKNRSQEGNILNNIGQVYMSMGRHEKALESYEQALALSREAKDRSSEGLVIGNMGYSHYSLGRFDKAVEHYDRALAINRELKNRITEASDLFALGTTYADLGQVDRSIEHFQQSLAIYSELKARGAEGPALHALGNAYASLGRFEKAMEFFEQSLAVAREVKSRNGEGSSLLALGNAHRFLGRYEKADALYQQALDIAREVKNRSGEAGVLQALGTANGSRGHYEKAIEFFEQVLAIQRELKSRSGEASALQSLAITYGSLGRNEKAIELLVQVLAINREIRARSAEGRTLYHLGTANSYLGRHEKAIEYNEQALAIQREVKNRSAEGLSLTNLAWAYSSLGQYGKAIEHAEKAVTIARETKVRWNEFGPLNVLGGVYRLQGQYEKAVQLHEQALAIARETQHRSGEASALSALMHDRKALNQPGPAIFFGKQAVNVYQEIRGNVSRLDLESQQSYLRFNEKTYRQLADLLIAQGRLPEAEQVIGLLKEEEYFDFVRRDASDEPKGGKAKLTPGEEALEKRYSEILDKLAEIGTERRTLIDKKARTPEEELRLAKLDTDLAVAGNEFQKFLDTVTTSLASSAEAGVKVYQLRESQGLMEDLRELGKGVVALYTLVGEDKYRVILTTPDFQKGYEYPIKGTDLNRKVLEFREVLQNPKFDPSALSQELYKIMLGPVARDLAKTKAQTIMWSLDGVLRYVPVAALNDGKQYLVEQYQNVVFTPASQARLKDLPTRNWSVLGLGVTKAQGENIPALPGVADEMRGIVNDGTDGKGVLPGTIKLDEQFTQEAMLTGLRQRPPVVHVASHFQFTPGNETNSALLLGDGTFLSLAQIKSLPNVFSGVELLTLSACNTATGGSGANGKEVEGFGVLAQRQGAKAVVASLWPVADQSTKVLMQDFYRLRQAKPGTTKAEALRQAQGRLLRGGTISNSASASGELADRQLVHESSANKVSFTRDSRTPYAHPYYWAPFILIGNWK